MGIVMEGIVVHNLKQIFTPKGNIYHALKATDVGYSGFGEAYFSNIEAGEIKGWKRHNRFTLNIIVPVGAIKFVFYDDRSESLTYGQFEEHFLSPNGNYKRLTISPGIWMAFEGLGDKTSLLLDIIPEPHMLEETDNKSFEEIPYTFNK